MLCSDTAAFSAYTDAVTSPSVKPATNTATTTTNTTTTTAATTTVAAVADDDRGDDGNHADVTSEPCDVIVVPGNAAADDNRVARTQSTACR